MVNLDLNLNRKSPIVVTQDGLEVLLDTGAKVPVFSIGIEQFKEYFPTAIEQTDKQCTIRGFGGDCEAAPVYIVRNLFLGKGCCIHNLPIVIQYNEHVPDIVLPFLCIGRYISRFTYGTHPFFTTDCENCYALAHYNDIELIYVSICTKEEYDLWKEGKSLLMQDSGNDINKARAIAADVYKCLPESCKEDEAFGVMDAVFLCYKQYRNFLK